MNTKTILSSAILAASAMLQSTPAHASVDPASLRYALSHGSVACSGNNSGYQNMLGTRSEGRRNSGSTSVSVVTCGGIATPMNYGGDVIAFEVGFNNSTASNISVSCSLVDGLGVAGGTVTTVYPKNVVIPAGGTAYLDWNGGDTGGTGWDNGPAYIYPSLSCNLTPKAEIAYTAIVYREYTPY